ncbi:MAG: C39 family peptidase [Patescibacteria group bacterium]|jgi:hypothetical protein|nr:C39 family peptidase [Patescibacteria group bacterium]
MKFKAILVTILMVILTVGCQSDNRDLVEPLQENSTSLVSTATPDIVNSPAEKPVVADVSESPSELPTQSKSVVSQHEPSLSTPKNLEYQLAFVSQAPFGVWDELHKEACEEASMITVVKYFKSEILNAHTMEQGILDLVSWEKSQGYQVDLTAQEVVDILNSHFDLAAELITVVDVSVVKDQLTNGKLVIVPLAGRVLNNPYFQNPGPIYHMLVIRGFDDQSAEFITNEVGTRRGDGFRYAYGHLINSIHDWDHDLAKDGMTDNEISGTPKAIISVGTKID